MDHDWELFSPILEMLEIEVFNILYDPGIIVNWSLHASQNPGNVGEFMFYFLRAWTYWKLRSATFSIILEILENGFFSIQSYPGNSGSYDPYISPILEIMDRTIHISVLSWKYWIVRSIFSPILEMLDRTIHISCSPILEIVHRTIHMSVLQYVELYMDRMIHIL